MDDKNTVNVEMVRTLATLLNRNGLTEIEYDNGSIRLRVARNGTPVDAPIPAESLTDEESFAAHPGAVVSPMVGVAYMAPEPGAAAFIEVGSTVAQGDTLMLIEAIKTFNPIRAPKAGRVARILVDNGTPVEFGQVLVIIE